MGNIKILISCHKQSIVPDSEIMLPIEVGADLRSKHIEGYIQDNSGDNISAKNKMYCELTAQLGMEESGCRLLWLFSLQKISEFFREQISVRFMAEYHGGTLKRYLPEKI